MSNSKINRNAPCPYGSGKKYKKCCIGRIGSTNSDLYIDDEGVHLIGEGTGPKKGSDKAKPEGFINIDKIKSIVSNCILEE